MMPLARKSVRRQNPPASRQTARACAGVATVLLALLCFSPGLAAQPNVLFLAVDDMNDWIGCLETTPRAITPNLDRLAARGVSFTNAHTAGVFCAPSRAAIFSGQYASTTGCYRTATYFVDHPEIESLQTSFSKAGYETYGAGKLFHHPAGAIDVRGWSEFFLRDPGQRERGWPLDSWSRGTPFPEPFPNSTYNRGQEITGGLFLEWGAVPERPRRRDGGYHSNQLGRRKAPREPGQAILPRRRHLRSALPELLSSEILRFV